MLDPYDLSVGVRSVRLYRAVCEAEYEPWKQTGMFEIGSNTLEGKWFAMTPWDAVEWGNRFSATSGIAHDRIIAVKVPEELYEQFAPKYDKLDGIGPATFAPIGLLRGRRFDEVSE